MRPVFAGFEDFLPLLFFFVLWWISSKKKKARRQQPPATTASKSEAGKEGFSLQEILRQVLVGEVEMPQPAEPSPSRPSYRVELEEEEDFDFEEQWQPPPAGRPQPQEVMPPPEAVPDSGAPMQPAAPQHCQALGRRFAAVRMGRCDLRRAVVWSEILGTPVGLRE